MNERSGEELTRLGCGLLGVGCLWTALVPIGIVVLLAIVGIILKA